MESAQGGGALEAHNIEEDAAVIGFVQPAGKSGFFAACDHLKELEGKMEPDSSPKCTVNE